MSHTKFELSKKPSANLVEMLLVTKILKINKVCMYVIFFIAWKIIEEIHTGISAMFDL